MKIDISRKEHSELCGRTIGQEKYMLEKVFRHVFYLMEANRDMYSLIKKNKYILVALTGPASAMLFILIYLQLGAGFLHNWSASIPIPFFAFYTSGILRLALATAAISVLGWLIGQNGFKYAFSTKGTMKAFFAFIVPSLHFFWVLPLLLLPSIFGVVFSSPDQLIALIPSHIFFNLAVSIYEEVVFRGLFLVTILYFFGNNAIGRLLCIIPPSILFALGHPFSSPLIFFAWFVVAAAYCAAFTYSKNLLVMMFMHFTSNIIAIVGRDLISSTNNDLIASIIRDRFHEVVVFLLIPVFIIYLCIKATPIREEIKLRFAE